MEDTPHSLPTVAMPKAPTLPILLAEQVTIDKRIAVIERSLWYFLTLFIFQELLLVVIVSGIAYLIGRH